MKNINKFSFEEAYTKLKEIVNIIEKENKNLSLEKMSEYYETGKQLHSICKNKLTNFELKIQECNKKI